MFSKKPEKKLIKATENSEHCFIELKQHEIKRRNVGDCYEPEYTYTAEANYFKELGPNYTLLASLDRESDFSFHKELDAKPGSGGSFNRAIDEGFEIRLSVKINMSLDQLNALLNSIYYNWHGVVRQIPDKYKEVRKIFEDSLMNSYVDIKDKNTHEWYRIETKEFNKKHKHTCQLL
jgi:hypothetical protein